jgi:hypothetical protein
MRRERPILRTGTGMSRMAASHEKPGCLGLKKQKKSTKARIRSDHAKNKDGSERKAQRLKGRSITP